MTNPSSTTTSPAAGSVVDLGRPWQGVGPFLFGAYHLDAYPRGNADMGPVDGTAGHAIGNDFGHPSGWNMYHGQTVPGFPAHPHRGFETITIVARGFVDHADSTGASARYGAGDVQWVTAGRGVSHAEMFPLLDTEGDNPFELYQLWLNLPARSKGVDPEFTMQWGEQVPVVTAGPDGARARVRVVAGSFDGKQALAPPRHSWAAEDDADVAVWLVELEPGASVDLPDVATDRTERMLYVHGEGASVVVNGATVRDQQGFVQDGRDTLALQAGESGATVLVLQGVPIGEPVVAHGPFVMNTQAEIAEAFDDYRRTQFGGWPWESTAMVHPRETPRFARYGDGRLEHPASA